MYEYVYRYVYRYHIWSVFVGFLADLSDATDPLDVVKGMSTLIMVCLVVQVSRWFINSQYIYNCEDFYSQNWEGSHGSAQPVLF